MQSELGARARDFGRESVSGLSAVIGEGNRRGRDEVEASGLLAAFGSR